MDGAFDVGIAGAGQLARMTVLAAWDMDLRVAVLGHPDEPAAPMAAGLVEGDWRDAAAIGRLGEACAVVTLENEFVDPAALAAVEAAGTPVRPLPGVLARIQDKALQKDLLHSAGLPVTPFRVATAAAELHAIGSDLGWPLVLKARRLGYDGYGNATCRTPRDAEEAFARLDAGDGVLVEAFVPFARELAVMVARDLAGADLAYPVVETIQRDHICHEVLAPAPVDAATRAEAEAVARAVAAAASGLGVTGVELFHTEDGRVLVNEIAPRPHNSGHYTIEACETSQFENHLRGVLGLRLGPVEMRMPVAVMVNVLGTRTGPAAVDRAAALRHAGAHVHVYGKREVRKGRKMGHVTTLGQDMAEARRRAAAAAAGLGL